VSKKVSIVTNLCIAVVLVGLGVAVFTVNLADVFISVSAPVAGGNRTNNNVSLMFVLEDDATYVNEIASLLIENNVDATFFVGGGWASRNRPTVMKLAEHFELGNHAHNNRALAGKREAEQRAELETTHTLVKAITASVQLTEDEIEPQEGVCMQVFLPPHGAFDRATLRAAERLGYRTVMWSRDATTNVFDSATRDIMAGDFVLLRANLATFTELHRILRFYQNAGLGVTSVSENLI